MIEIYTNDIIYADNLKFGNLIYKLILRNFNETNKVINRGNKGEAYKIIAKSNQSSDVTDSIDNDVVYDSSISYIYQERKPFIAYANPNANYKPVMINYIAAKKGYTVKYDKARNRIFMYKDKKFEKLVIQAHLSSHNKRAFVSSEFFAVNFEGWDEIDREHNLNDLFDSEKDATMALGSINYGKNLSTCYKIEKISNKYKISALPYNRKNEEFDTYSDDMVYYQVASNFLYRMRKGREYRPDYSIDMKAIMVETKKSYGKKLEYSYEKKICNNIELNIIKTHAENIGFAYLNLDKTLKGSDYFGINGGWYGKSIVTENNKSVNRIVPQNIASINGNSLKNIHNDEAKDGRINCNGSDIVDEYIIENGKYSLGASGTLVYANFKMYCLIRHTEGSIKKELEKKYGIKNGFTWAQGGVSMTLNSDSEWLIQASKENLPTMGLQTYRTAMVADSKNNIYLIVTGKADENKCTIEDFRDAIKQYLGIGEGNSNTDYMGIFLDGSTCSQLKCKDSSGNVIGVAHERNLAQIITLINEIPENIYIKEDAY